MIYFNRYSSLSNCKNLLSLYSFTEIMTDLEIAVLTFRVNMFLFLFIFLQSQLKQKSNEIYG